MNWKQVIIYGLFFVAALSIPGNTEVLPKLLYIDLDGDGFSDNMADNNDNGIPDRFESKPAETMAEMGSLLGNVFNTDVNLDDLLGNTEKFNTRKFRCRSLPQRCNGLGAEDDFGPGNGIGLGAMSGGSSGCAGGVCGP